VKSLIFTGIATEMGVELSARDAPRGASIQSLHGLRFLDEQG